MSVYGWCRQLSIEVNRHLVILILDLALWVRDRNVEIANLQSNLTFR